jgi:uncharacterized membrane protein YfcA
MALLEDALILIVLLIAGIFAGFINVMAGGGSVITLGAMLLMGIDTTLANGSNRVAILFETFAAISTFKKAQVMELSTSFKYSLLTIPGAVLGAFYAIQISDETFQLILVLVIVFVIGVILFPIQHLTSFSRLKQPILLSAGLVLVGFYGGFIQAGVGFVIMICFSLFSGMTLLQTNAHKALIVLMYTLPVVAIFLIEEHINWGYAFALGIGNFIGAWLSARLAIKKGEQLIKRITVIAMIIMAIGLLI